MLFEMVSSFFQHMYVLIKYFKCTVSCLRVKKATKRMNVNEIISKTTFKEVSKVNGVSQTIFCLLI